MSIASAKVISASSVLPKGFVIVGWLEEHPNGLGAVTVLRSASGREVAWDGCAIKGLPKRWRESKHELAQSPVVPYDAHSENEGV